MRKGISIYFGFEDENSHEERIKSIKEAGFDSIITNYDKKFKKQNGSFKSQIRNFKKYNISPSSLHMRYNSHQLFEFFRDGKIGNKLEKNLIKDVKLAKKYGFSCVVVHLFCEDSSRQIGFERIKRILKLCEKLDLPLAIENIDDPDTFKALFNEIEHPYLKMCYDSGHNNCIDPECDYLTNYRDKIICFHLHDNEGKLDDHTLNKYGTIDWEKVASKIAKIPNELVLDYELLLVKRGNETREEVLSETFKQACQLEEMIEKYKKLNKKS